MLILYLFSFTNINPRFFLHYICYDCPARLSGKHCHGVCRRECTVIPDFKKPYALGSDPIMRTTNKHRDGPHWFEITREQFPGATVESSTFSMHVDALLPYKNKLPTITSEAGCLDTRCCL